jgi:hypothetical protein
LFMLQGNSHKSQLFVTRGEEMFQCSTIMY